MILYTPEPDNRLELDGIALVDGDQVELHTKDAGWIPATFQRGRLYVQLEGDETLEARLPLGGQWPVRWPGTSVIEPQT